MSGFALAASSAVLNGSFVVFSKLPSVKRAGVDPLVFQLWTSLGVFLSSLLTMPFFHGPKYPPEAIGWGVLAGGLFVCAVAFSFVAVQLVGLSIGQGIWSGSAVLVAFVWGVAAFGDSVTASVAGSGLALIVLGVLGIAGCADIAAKFGGEPVSGGGAGSGNGNGSSTGLDDLDDAEDGGGRASGGRHRERGARHSISVSGNVMDDPLLSLSPSSATLGSSVQMDLHSHLLEDGSMAPAPHRGSAGGGSLDLMHPVMQQQHQLHQLQQQYHQSSQQLPPAPQKSPRGSDYGGNNLDSNGTNGNGSNGNGQGWSSRQSSLYDSPTGGANGRYSPTPSTTLSASSAAYLAAASSKLSAQRQLYGSICAMVTGVFGGSILMPLQLAPEHVRGLSFVPSFGLGTLLVAPLITLPYMYLSRSSPSRGHWAVRESLLPGLMAGFVWNGANVCSIYAISDLGYAVAYPLMQCAIAVAAIWGVLVFKEIRGRQITVMAISALVVLGGAVLLALSKK